MCVEGTRKDNSPLNDVSSTELDDSAPVRQSRGTSSYSDKEFALISIFPPNPSGKKA